MSSVTGVRPQVASSTAAVRGRAGLRAALRSEVAKLAAQGRARYALIACAIAPVVIVFVLSQQARPPKDSLYGRYIHHSGYAMPLLILGFAGQWILPLLTAIVAGDMFASEDQHGTWKTVLTRSVGRTQVFWAKTLTAAGFACLTLLVLTASTVISSMVIVGTQPLVGLSGQVIAPGSALVLVLASWATALAPLLGFTALAILLSVRSRNPAVAIAAPVVIGMVMQLGGSLGGFDVARRALLTTPFESWHGLLAEHVFVGPLLLGLAVSAVWTVACLAAAFFSHRRRDITGG